jgi:hypothetical protein
LLVGGACVTATADETIVENSYGQRELSRVSSGRLGLAALQLGDTIHVAQLNTLGIDDRASRAHSLLLKPFVTALFEQSSFARVETCEGYSVPLHGRRQLPLSGNRVVHVPEPADVGALPCEGFSMLLWVYIAAVTEDTANVTVHFTDVAMMYEGARVVDVVRHEIPQERMNISAEFAMWNMQRAELVLYGHVTAEGEGERQDRFGPFGCWSQAAAELARQILQDTQYLSDDGPSN